MKKILVAVAGYPDNMGNVALAFVHTRNIYYKQQGLDVTVLNFEAKNNYIIDGIPVITLKSYKTTNISYDILICHAANIRNHYKFIRKYGFRFDKYIFFFHGHEVLKINNEYPKPYKYNKRNYLKETLQNIYDEIKLMVWRKYYLRVIRKSTYIFVSQWMFNKFCHYTKILPEQIKSKSHIIYNGVGEEFVNNSYDNNCEKKYDFITIRNNIDGSKYCIDLICSLAENTPDGEFLLVGKGKFFNYNKKPNNLTWINKNLTHDEIVSTLNLGRYALMPTRTDAQGLMMCEMAAFGIPVITSDISVCHEVFDDCENAFFISNCSNNQNLNLYLKKKCAGKKYTRFYPEKTIQMEINLIKKLEG